MAKITTAELKQIMSARDDLSHARKEVRRAEAELEVLEKSVMDRLRAGVAIDSKTMTASIATEDGICRPAWKDEYLAHMLAEHDVAESAAENDVRAKYPPGPREKLAIAFVTK